MFKADSSLSEEAVLSLIGAVLGRDGQIVGVAFIVSGTLAATCAHVVLDALKLETTLTAPNELVDLDFPRLGKKTKARIVHWAPVKDGRGDLALLSIEDPDFVDPIEAPTLRQLDDFPVPDLRCYGFPERLEVPELRTVPPDERPVAGGGWAADLRAVGRNVSDMIQLHMHNDGQWIERKYSGSPVFNRQNQIVAMAVESVITGGRVAFAIDSEQIRLAARALDFTPVQTKSKETIQLRPLPIHSLARQLLSQPDRTDPLITTDELEPYFSGLMHRGGRLLVPTRQLPSQLPVGMESVFSHVGSGAKGAFINCLPVARWVDSFARMLVAKAQQSFVRGEVKLLSSSPRERLNALAHRLRSNDRIVVIHAVGRRAASEISQGIEQLTARTSRFVIVLGHCTDEDVVSVLEPSGLPLFHIRAPRARLDTTSFHLPNDASGSNYPTDGLERPECQASFSECQGFAARSLMYQRLDNLSERQQWILLIESIAQFVEMCSRENASITNAEPADIGAIYAEHLFASARSHGASLLADSGLFVTDENGKLVPLMPGIRAYLDGLLIATTKDDPLINSLILRARSMVDLHPTERRSSDQVEAWLALATASRRLPITDLQFLIDRIAVLDLSLAEEIHALSDRCELKCLVDRVHDFIYRHDSPVKTLFPHAIARPNSLHLKPNHQPVARPEYHTARELLVLIPDADLLTLFVIACASREIQPTSFGDVWSQAVPLQLRGAILALGLSLRQNAPTLTSGAQIASRVLLRHQIGTVFPRSRSRGSAERQYLTYTWLTAMCLAIGLGGRLPGFDELTEAFSQAALSDAALDSIEVPHGDDEALQRIEWLANDAALVSNLPFLNQLIAGKPGTGATINRTGVTSVPLERAHSSSSRELGALRVLFDRPSSTLKREESL